MNHLNERLQPVFPVNALILVGVCAAGKSTVSQLLWNDCGIPAKPVAQEHSRISRLYRHKGERPVVLLGASWKTVHRRRKISYGFEFYREEWKRILDARHEASLIVSTDTLSPAEVRDVICEWWDRKYGLVWLASIPPLEAVAIRYQVAQGATSDQLQSFPEKWSEWVNILRQA